MRINERALRKLQKQRHMYDIQNMILTNPLFKNLNKREQRILQKLIYKAEMTEIFIRDRNVIRINESFDDLVEDVARILDNIVEQDEKRYKDDDDEDFK